MKDSSPFVLSKNKKNLRLVFIFYFLNNFTNSNNIFKITILLIQADHEYWWSQELNLGSEMKIILFLFFHYFYYYYYWHGWIIGTTNNWKINNRTLKCWVRFEKVLVWCKYGCPNNWEIHAGRDIRLCC